MDICHDRPHIKGFSAKEAEEELCVRVVKFVMSDEMVT
jgi:hypothetical protein